MVDSLDLTMTTGKYNLAWNYEDRCSTVVESLMNLQKGEEFSDVTLVTEDDALIKSHRIILSTCSPAIWVNFLE